MYVVAGYIRGKSREERERRDVAFPHGLRLLRIQSSFLWSEEERSPFSFFWCCQCLCVGALLNLAGLFSAPITSS